MARLAAAEAEFRCAVQREQAALMASGLGRVEVSTAEELSLHLLSLLVGFGKITRPWLNYRWRSWLQQQTASRRGGGELREQTPRRLATTRLSSATAFD